MNKTEENLRRIQEYNRAHVGDTAFGVVQDDWDESKHPRAANGQFGSGGGSAPKAKNSTWATGAKIKEVIGSKTLTPEKLMSIQRVCAKIDKMHKGGTLEQKQALRADIKKDIKNMPTSTALKLFKWLEHNGHNPDEYKEDEVDRGVLQEDIDVWKGYAKKALQIYEFASRFNDAKQFKAAKHLLEIAMRKQADFPKDSEDFAKAQEDVKNFGAEIGLDTTDLRGTLNKIASMK